MSANSSSPGEFPGRRRRRWIVFGAIIAFAAVLAFQGVRTKSWNPVYDENEYLGYGYSILHHGTYGLPSSREKPAPSFVREPGFPLLIAGVMALDPRLRAVSPTCWQGKLPACDTRPYRSLQWLNIVLVALTAFFVSRAALLLSGSWIVALVGAGAIALNIQTQALRFSVMSDFLAMTLLALAVWLAIAAMRSRGKGATCGCGLALAGLVLTKAIFLYFLVLAVVAVAVAAFILRKHRLGSLAAAFVIVSSLPVLGWMSYQKASGGSLAIVNSTRTAIALSGRERFNDMTASEWATAFLWWTRAVGDNIARRHLSPELHHRVDDGSRDGYFQSGEARYRVLRDELLKTPGVGLKEANAVISRDMAGRIMERPFKHLVVSLPFTYRGIWIDEFAVLSVPALFIVLLAAARRRQWEIAVAFAPGLYSLAIYPLASVNFPRYQMTAVPLLALALALAVGLYLDRRKVRRQIAK